METERMKKLVDKLNKASDAYYNKNNPIMSDYEWDSLFDELQTLESDTEIVLSNSPTQHPGYEVKSKLEKVTHSHPMLSLGKTKSVEDLKEFSGGKDCIISLKMDGLTVLNTYENNVLIQSETRGNGTIGELITHNAKVFDNLPLHISNSHKIEFEGEAIITKDDFEKINQKLPDDKKYKNPRNLVSGSVRQLDSRIAKERHIKFIVWKLPHGFTRFTDGFNFAAGLGFDVVPYVTYNSSTDNVNEKIEELKAITEEKSYPIDGLVITYDNVEYGKSLGMTGHHPRHSLAFKFYDEEEVTILRDIEWSIGKTGSLTPVAIFDDVELDGTIVNRASLHNVSIFKELQLGIGDEITVFKANQIIPQLRENLTKSYTCKIPSTCPICGALTEIVKENDSEVLFCSNNDCSGKLLGKLKHAASRNALNIDGLSEATLERFIQLGWLKSIKDIYHLKDYELKMKSLSGFGQRKTKNLLSSIEASRNTSLEQFLYALSCPLLGQTASKAIVQAITDENNDDFGTFMKVMTHSGAKYFRHIPGIGDSLISSLDQYFSKHCSEIFELSKEFTFDKKEPTISQVLSSASLLAGKTFVITGSVNHYANRDAMKADIEAHGGKVSGSISSKTSYLINNDISSNSSKNQKAKSLNIPIISEDELLSMMQ